MKVSIFTAKEQLLATAALFTEAGLDLGAMLALNDSTALKAHLGTLTTPVSLTADHPAVAAFIAAARRDMVPSQDLARVESHLGALTAGLSAVGIAPKASDAEAGLVAADVQVALKGYAAKEARALLASKGFSTKALDDAPVADPTAPSAKPKAELKGRARTEAAFRAQSAAAAL